ncbi:MAG TPA: histidine kinase dimerization/phospho-acceptor domain-containing protein [Polyangiaceae bacterium]|jgi:signal transduction histidine kinase|nr:histidine kinase dimerization/phospho-acceptor domain-containing protein [Polyangiaceae bacterium]
MTRLVLVAAAAIGLILLVAFITQRLVRARTAGMSIRMQIFLALAGIVGAFALGVGLLVLDRIEARATLLATEAARDEAQAIARFVGAEMSSGSVSIQDIAKTLRREGEGHDVHLVLLDTRGQVVFGEGAQEPGTVVVEVPIVAEGRVLGSIRVLKPTIIMRRLLADFAPTVLVISVTLGAAAALAAAVIGRAIATPIEGLTAFAVRVSEGETSVVPPLVHGKEVKRLTRAIDSMRRELEGRPFLETFAADLSHELKNPVAAVRASAEVLEEGALAEPEEARRFVARIREATARIETLLGEILSLARIEARGLEESDEVDVGALARAASEAAKDRGAAVELSIETNAIVRGQSNWLARAIDNLIDNAIVHGDPEGPSRIVVRREGERIAVLVVNQGTVPKHVRTNLFRRFVTTRAAGGGTGLGLAIVRAVAEAHGGKAELLRPGPPQVEFRLTFPAV